MIRRKSTYSLTILLSLLILAYGCGRKSGIAPEDQPQTGSRITDSRGFDPLELPRDMEVVPARYPRSGSISGGSVLIDTAEVQQSDSPDSLGIRPPLTPIDSVNNQAYRVQLETSNVYDEARRAAAVAEEIFDQPVFVDYEVPNYKVRVGSFADRDQAEQYRQIARTAGYTNAWVVMVNVRVKKLAPLYDNQPFIGPLQPSDSTEIPVDSLNSDGDH